MSQCGTMGKTLQRSDDNFDHGGRVEVGDGVGGGEESSCQQITIMIKLKIKLKKISKDNCGVTNNFGCYT